MPCCVIGDLRRGYVHFRGLCLGHFTNLGENANLGFVPFFSFEGRCYLDEGEQIGGTVDSDLPILEQLQVMPYSLQRCPLTSGMIQNEGITEHVQPSKGNLVASTGSTEKLFYSSISGDSNGNSWVKHARLNQHSHSCLSSLNSSHI